MAAADQWSRDLQFRLDLDRRIERKAADADRHPRVVAGNNLRAQLGMEVADVR